MNSSDDGSNLIANSIKLQAIVAVLSSPIGYNIPNSVKKKMMYKILELTGIRLNTDELKEIEEWLNPAKPAQPYIRSAVKFIPPKDSKGEDNDDDSSKSS